MGLRLRSRGYEQPPYQEARGTSNSKRLTAARSDNSGIDLRLERLDSCSNGFRANAAAEKPSPVKDENQPFKPKRRRSGVWAALAVSSAETTSAPTATCSPTPHQRTASAQKAHRQVLVPVLATRTRTGSSQNTTTTLAAYDVLADPP
jgi:hypothetical protein